MSRTLHTIYFPHVSHSAIALCFHTIVLKEVQEDVSTALLPWCNRVHTAKFIASPVSLTVILLSLTVLRERELAGLTFTFVAEYFTLLASLPSTVKELMIRKNMFHESQPTRLHTDSAADLVAFLREECPVSLASLRAATLRYPGLQDFEEYPFHLIYPSIVVHK
ncbi:hypothetical protein ARMGADRAFT_1085958 [Armillaria gallica]|uniref:Uncharacterized protein n=1 Tax=Armillaria gallica TaxID=47427 RepID=A0A2H3CZF1_ARMGA|nr:hypothetical protein ARMGADRAFT_1085958 [Armillaria gallica]